MDERLITDICKAHGLIIADCLRRLGSIGVRMSNMQFQTSEEGDEYLTCDRRGFRIVKEITDEGRISFHAVPGHFAVQGGGVTIWQPNAKDKILYEHERAVH